MGQYDFTYEIPSNLKGRLCNYLSQDYQYKEMSAPLAACRLDGNIIDYAYYAGLRGDNWNKKAIDILIEGSADNINALQPRKKDIAESIQKLLKPNETGLLIRNLDFLVNEDALEIKLPEESGENYDALAQDIYNALANGEPTLVLDRLHTYSSKYLRAICSKHLITTVDDKGTFLPLHSLAGALAKYYEGNMQFQSSFVISALKSSISIFERFNAVRNNESYAHDNDVLNKSEAMYVVTIITATLNLLRAVEKV